MIEKRIYVLLPITVETSNGKIAQPPGRQVAQACHVTNEMRSAKKYFKVTTTIILQVRDCNEIAHICHLLRQKSVGYYLFHDENPEYGRGRYLSAMCTAPVEPFKVENILGYLPLWPSQ